MEIDFDPEKDAANRRKHGLSLREAGNMDFDTAVYRTDDRFDYGEDRVQAIGYVGVRLHMLVYTVRGTTLRPISLRKANQKEIERYASEAATAAGLRRKPGMD